MKPDPAAAAAKPRRAASPRRQIRLLKTAIWAIGLAPIPVAGGRVLPAEPRRQSRREDHPRPGPLDARLPACNPGRHPPAAAHRLEPHRAGAAPDRPLRLRPRLHPLPRLRRHGPALRALVHPRGRARPPLHHRRIRQPSVDGAGSRPRRPRAGSAAWASAGSACTAWPTRPPGWACCTTSGRSRATPSGPWRRRRSWPPCSRCGWCARGRPDANNLEIWKSRFHISRMRTPQNPIPRPEPLARLEHLLKVNPVVAPAGRAPGRQDDAGATAGRSMARPQPHHRPRVGSRGGPADGSRDGAGPPSGPRGPRRDPAPARDLPRAAGAGRPARRPGPLPRARKRLAGPSAAELRDACGQGGPLRAVRPCALGGGPGQHGSPLAARRVSALVHGRVRGRQQPVAARLRPDLSGARHPPVGRTHFERHAAALLVDACPLPRAGVERRRTGPGVRRVQPHGGQLPRAARSDLHGAHRAALVREPQEAPGQGRPRSTFATPAFCTGS